MRIIWIQKKYLDIAMDSVTWIETVKALEARGNSVRLATTYRYERPKAGQSNGVIFLPSVKVKGLNHLTFNASALAYLLFCVSVSKPDIVIVDSNSALIALPFSLLSTLGLLRTRFVLDIRTVPVELSPVMGRVEQVMFDMAVRQAGALFDGITAITEYMKQVLVDQFGLDRHKVGVWSSGFSPDHFNPAQLDPEDTRRLRDELGLGDRLVAVYHGSLSEHRGLVETVEAFAMLKERSKELALLILGKGPIRTELDRLVASMGLEDMVLIADAIPYEDVPRYLSLADVGILPFPHLMWWRVSSPIKLMEYLAMGKPVILTDIEAHRDVLDGQACALFVESCDAGHIAEGLKRAQRLGRVRLGELGASARSIVEREYSWARQAQKLEDFLLALEAAT